MLSEKDKTFYTRAASRAAQVLMGRRLATHTVVYPFRDRYKHICRVVAWAQRLSEQPWAAGIDRELLYTAAWFHDVGYADADRGEGHAALSLPYLTAFLREEDWPEPRIEKAAFFVSMHSDKELMTCADTPRELILLQEADLLDETGALGIVWDCLAEGIKQEYDYDTAYNNIRAREHKLLDRNPMISPLAKQLWLEKQALHKAFTDSLQRDLQQPEK